MAPNRELETKNWGSCLNCLVFSTRDNTVVLETNIEAFVYVQSLEPPPEAETNFVPFNRMHESRIPFSTWPCPCRLKEDLVTNQHAGPLLRKTRNRKASKFINFSPRSKDESTNKWNGCRYSILAFVISNFSRFCLDTHQFYYAIEHQFWVRTRSCIPHTKAAFGTFVCMFRVINVVQRTSSQRPVPDPVVECEGRQEYFLGSCRAGEAMSIG